MAAYTLYDVLRHLAGAAAWPSEEDKRAALESIGEAEKMAVLGNTARNIECPHDDIQIDGRCADCGRTINVGHGGSINRSAITRQGWR